MATLVKEQFKLDPLDGRAFPLLRRMQRAFQSTILGRSRDFWLLYKRFENGKMAGLRIKTKFKPYLLWLMKSNSFESE
ncbi:hypothetical protein [Lactobacillus acidophilus]|uniref:hypothetical protein n=1 Tax=Lactobacillus acidophilus TaxID=1579 RepID=UPI0035D0FD64